MRAEIPITVPDFLTDTRIRFCLALKCRWHGMKDFEEFTCKLKQVKINDSGSCDSFESLEKTDDN